MGYHLIIRCLDDEPLVVLMGQARFGDRIASSVQGFTLREHKDFQGFGLLRLNCEKTHAQIANLAGTIPPLTKITLRGDMSWMGQRDRELISAYRRDIEMNEVEG